MDLWDKPDSSWYLCCRPKGFYQCGAEIIEFLAILQTQFKGFCACGPCYPFQPDNSRDIQLFLLRQFLLGNPYPMYRFICITREKVYNWVHFNDSQYEALFHAYIKCREREFDKEGLWYPDKPVAAPIKRKRLIVELDFPDTGDTTADVQLKELAVTTRVEEPLTPPPDNVEECLLREM